MKTARQVLLIIGYVILISFFAFSLYFSISTLTEVVEESSTKLLPMLVLIGLGGIFYGITLIIALVTLVLNLKLHKEGYELKFILDGLLVVLPIIFEFVLVFMLLGI